MRIEQPLAGDEIVDKAHPINHRPSDARTAIHEMRGRSCIAGDVRINGTDSPPTHSQCEMNFRTAEKLDPWCLAGIN